MEMDMSNPMNELDKLASGLEKLSIRKPIKYGGSTKYTPKGEETISLEDAVQNSKAEKSREFLQEAHGIVYGDRHEEYGDASVNFTNIARLWTAYVLMDKDCMKEVEETFKFTQEDVAFMMMLLKISRCNNKEETGEDSLRDIVGYTTILHRFKFLDD
jgi:hypothetical protein